MNSTSSIKSSWAWCTNSSWSRFRSTPPRPQALHTWVSAIAARGGNASVSSSCPLLDVVVLHQQSLAHTLDQAKAQFAASALITVDQLLALKTKEESGPGSGVNGVLSPSGAVTVLLSPPLSLSIHHGFKLSSGPRMNMRWFCGWGIVSDQTGSILTLHVSVVLLSKSSSGRTCLWWHVQIKGQRPKLAFYLHQDKHCNL